MRTKRMNRRLCFWNFASLLHSWRNRPGRHRRTLPATGCLHRLSRLAPNFPYRRGLLALSLVLPATALAGPAGEQVTAGIATVTRPNSTTTLITQQTSKAVIDWQNFSIAQPEMVRFQQPGTESIALNRVLGNDPSRIFGSLSANGQVFLVNPNGVLFSPGSQVSVHGLLATTHSLDNDDFLAGRYTFSPGANLYSTAEVVNQGNLAANAGGYIVLAGDYAANTGVISARLGQVALASGNRFTLDLEGDELIGLAVDAASLAARAGVENFGTLAADGGQVVMTAKVAGELAGTVVNNTGLVQARSIGEYNGEIILYGGTQGIVASSGSLDASGRNIGESGGSVRMLGEKVGLLDQAIVDVSGGNGGGTALIGGDFQGRPLQLSLPFAGTAEPLPNAQATYLGKETTIIADAFENGNGGKVIAWADGTTRAYGEISARGGESGGNGGFVEVSGKGYLNFLGTVDTRAPVGTTGTLLLDPTDITITTLGGAPSFGSFALSGSDQIFDGGANAISTMGWDYLNGLLSANNVIVQTSSAGGGTGNITFSEAGVSAGGTYSLSFLAENNITVSNSIQFTSSGDLIMVAGWLPGSGYVTPTPTHASTTGNMAINADITSTGGGNIKLLAKGAVTVDAPITTSNTHVSLSGNNITFTALGDISAGTGTVNLVSTGTDALTSIVAGTAISGSDITIKTDNLSLAGTLGATGIANITRSTAGNELQLGVGAADSATTLGIDDTELANILAGIYRFGDIVSEGGLRITGNVSIPGTRTLSLLTSTISNSQIVQNGGATITADYLRAEGTAVTLTQSNAVGTLAGKSKGQNFSFTNGAAGVALTIGTVDGQSGIDASQGPNNVTLTTTAGGGIADATGTNPILADSLSITAFGDVKLLGANSVNKFAADVTSSTVASDVYFKNNKTLDLNGSISTYFHSGDVGLWLTAGDLTQSAGTIYAANLVLMAEQGNVTLTGANTLTNLAAKVGTNGTYEHKTFRFNNSSALNIGRLLTSDAAFNTTSGISIAISDDYTSATDAGVIDLSTASGSITQTANALLAGNAVRARVGTSDAAGSVLLTEANTTGVIAGSAGTAANPGDFEYTSASSIWVTTVGAGGNQSAGISTPNSASHITLTSTGYAVSQDAPLTTKELAAVAVSGISLTNASNSVATFAGQVTGTGNIYFSQSGESTLTIGTVDGVIGIDGSTALAGDAVVKNDKPAGTLVVNNVVDAAADKDVLLAAPGALTINAQVSGGDIFLRSDSAISFGGGGSAVGLTGTDPGLVQLATYTGGTAIDISSNPTGGGLNINTSALLKINAPWVVFGSEESLAGSGSGTLTVDGVDAATSFLTTVPSVLGFLSGDGYNIALSNISIPSGTLGATSGNNLTGTALGAATLVAETRNAGDIVNLAFNSGFTVGSLATTNWDGTPESYSGVRTNNGNITLTAVAGINIPSQIDAGTGSVTLTSSTGRIYGSDTSPDIIGSSVSVTANGADGANFAIDGINGLHIQSPSITLSAPAGSIDVRTMQATTLNSTSALDDISVIPLGTAYALSIGGPMNAGGSITLVGSSVTQNANITTTSSTDFVSVSATTGNIAIDPGAVTSTAGAAISYSAPNGTVTYTNANFSGATPSITQYVAPAPEPEPEPPPPPPPSLDACTTNPTLAGCSGVLPSLDTCTSNPTAPGCTAVLPTLDTCTTTPTAAGCTAVLPSMDTCTATPTAPGCTAVLPPLTDCATNPALPGCTAVLPSIDTCTTTPTAPGCTAVLPPLTDCASNPTLAGCTAVLPSIDTCTTTPTAPGCTAVLPSMDTCTATPTAPGCTAVLPPLTDCSSNPALPGCTAVLPSIDTCTTTPTAPGCTAVLPSMDTCTATPTAPGCTAILPPLTDCSSNPALPGCKAVLPSINTCTATPTAPGCGAVLPPLVDCTTNPALPGCTAVLPSIDTCSATPTAPGCTAVLPTIITCTATPTAPGCTAVLPPLADCTTNPALAGCTAVLPPLATCATDPTLPGCTAVLPPLATCVTDPTLPGCTAVLPLPAAAETPVEIVETIQSVVVVALVLPPPPAPINTVSQPPAPAPAPAPAAEQPASSSQANNASGNTTNEENGERRAEGVPLTTTSQELPLAKQPIFDLGGGGIAGQNMVCR